MQKSDFDFEKLFLIFERVILYNLKEQDYDEFLIAYSGGIDSTTLLYLSGKIAKKLNKKISAVHVNHNLNKESKNWEIHCKNFCKDIRIPLKIINLNIVLNKGDSIEERAREDRYKFIYNLMTRRTVMMTAHHRDDQAETFVCQLLRGAGAKGLSSMPELKKIKKGYHIRPFLKLSKRDLNNIIKNNNLSYIKDNSNDDTKFSRNFIRKSIFPVIEKKWPSYSETISRSAFNLSESVKLNEELAKIDIKNYLLKEDNKVSVSIKELESYRFNNVIRFWIKKNNYRMPSSEQIFSIYKNILKAGKDKAPFFTCAEYEIRRYNDYIEIMDPLTKHDPSVVYVWEAKKNLVISSLSINLSWKNLEDRLGFEINKNVEVKFRKSGENIQIGGSKKSLKDYMRENKIPPWKRERTLLIYIDKELKAVWD